MRDSESMHKDHFWRVGWFWREKWRVYFPKHLSTSTGRKELAESFRQLADAIERGEV